MLEATRMRASPLHKRGTRRGCGRQREIDEDNNHDGFESDERDNGMERFRRQFMNELEERVREQPVLDRALNWIIERIKEIRFYMKTTKSGRILAVMLPFVGMILLGAVVVGIIEDWTPLG
jgi:hypothetical protein